ncbi:MAG: recombinase family protein [Rhodobacteraceae bacterium]|nr:recombinase family protein [Paracoccaceae bacterium]
MSTPRIRCAIYTRKSSGDGLEQDFNSLDAQFEACTAYIASQRHEGWRPVAQRYDDGGVSGGTLERPALQRLLVDIEAGRIDRIVVYKIDRLTRSLADFAKLIERLEAANCSFVSVTQAFNTSSSMGRLTLNVLLSFAQFEREVTAERIRDKLAASKKKGLWMGSVPPLGYDPHPDRTRRELVVNEAEAVLVRQLFTLYAEHGCLNAVAHETAARGLRSKRHHFSTGRTRGGHPFSRGQLHKILTNPVYRGLIRHKDKTWPGLHPAIIDEALWDEVQDKLQQASARRRGSPNGTAAGAPSLLGVFQDETGDRLTSSDTRRAGKRIAYYVSNRLLTAGPDATGCRLPALQFEAVISGTVAVHLAGYAEHHSLLAATDVRAACAATAEAASLALRIERTGIAAARQLIAEGRLEQGSLRLDLDRAALAKELGCQAEAIATLALTVEAPFELRRRGIEMKIIAGERERTPDPALLRALRHAHRWSAAIKSGIPLKQLARSEGLSDSYVARIVPLAGLSPRLQTAIVDGAQPVELTLRRLLRASLPLDWAAQERLFGITA